MKLQQLYNSGFKFLSMEDDGIYLEHPETGCIVRYDDTQDVYYVMWTAWDS